MQLAPLIQRLENRLQAPLPGQAAHARLARGLSRDLSLKPPTNARIAAVLQLIYPLDQQQAGIVYIRRSSREPRDAHAGQISFPGGSQEAADQNLAFTALREAEEEVGINPRQVQLLGALTPLYIPVSNFMVHPYLAYSEVRPDFIAQEAEVAEILEFPFADFLRPDALSTTSMTFGNGLHLPEVPYWDVGGEVIWGATSMLTAELVELLD
ncbi:MAG: CoA pyrophosphatase [Bacteroidota bacterium]